MTSFAYEPVPGSNLICLIGEADPFLARLVKRMAEKSGFMTKSAQTGEKLLELVQQEKPVLLILEPDLPGEIRGWQVAKKLQEETGASVLPVIFFSWLSKDAVQNLVGREVTFLNKPDLNYTAFEAALQAEGFGSSSAAE
jgi:DNA-binding response OmpR family regulator